MITNQGYIDNLNRELNEHPPFTKDDVYNEFEKYVVNKENLRHAIDCGIFHYDYIQYCTFMKDTLWEDGVGLIIEICKNAFATDLDRAAAAMKTGYAQVSKGFASFTQYLMLHPQIHEITRFDLLAKEAFQMIGERTENSLKPYVLFLSEMCRIIQNKESISMKFGVALDSLMSYNEIFDALYKRLLLDIPASQWRNISDHNDYDIKNDFVEVEYGSSNRIRKAISRKDLLILLKTIDVLLYMHKTAFTLLSIDYGQYKDVSMSAENRNENTKQDNFISQLVETSYAFNFELKNIDIESSPVEIVVVSKEAGLNKETLAKYLTIVANLLNKDYQALIYRKNKVEYKAICLDKKLCIFKFKV